MESNTKENRNAARQIIPAMQFTLSAKSLTLLLAVGVASTAAGSNLRRRRAALFHAHGDVSPSSTVSKQYQQQQQLRSPPSPSIASSQAVPASKDEDDADNDAVVDQQLAAAATAEPSLSTDKKIYLEGEDITVTFSVGSPSHPYYSSNEAPSLHVDHDYPKYSVGLFMRDADPQGGTLAPIVSVNACAAKGDDCSVDDRGYVSYSGLTVTFGSDHLDVMQGRWPLEVSRYGTGFDAYLLDGTGAAAIGPLEFYIKNEYGEEVDTHHSYVSTNTGAAASAEPVPISSSLAKNPLLKYQKGTKKATERQHVAASHATSITAINANHKIASGNGLEESGTTTMAEAAASADEEITTGPSLGEISSNKKEYEPEESITLDFSLRHSGDVGPGLLSAYRVGIFMRLSRPQGGTLEPVVSLPLCPNDGGCVKILDGALTKGTVTFGSESADRMSGSSWPIDLIQWGTGFDAYVLDERGDGVAGPFEFNVMTNDTY